MAVAITGFTYKKKLTVKTSTGGANLGGSLSNFPVCVVVDATTWSTTAEFNSFFSGNNNTAGKRVQFFASDGTTNLAYEVEKFTASTSAVYWVKVPSLSVSDTANFIYVAYGNDPNAADQDQKTSVWDSNFKGVWHLTNLTDSTSNATTLTGVGTTYAASAVADGVALNGTSSRYVYATLPAALQVQQHTIEFMGKRNVTGVGGYCVSLEGRGAWSDGRGAYNSFSAGDKFVATLGTGSGSWTSATGTTTISTGTWRHHASTYDGSALKAWVNASAEGTNSCGAVTISYDKGSGGPNPAQLYLGVQHNANDTAVTDTTNMAGWLDGTLDEVRVSNIARSADWLKATHFSMKATTWAGDNWLAWSAQEFAGNTKTVTADAIVAQAGTTASFTADASVKVLGATVALTGDANVAGRITATATADATVTARGSATATADATIVLPTTEPAVVKIRSGKIDVEDFTTYRRFDALNSATVTRTASQLQVAATGTHDVHAARTTSHTRFDQETAYATYSNANGMDPGYVMVNTNVSVCVDVLANNSSCDYSGVVSLVPIKTMPAIDAATASADRYAVRVAKTAGGTSTFQRVVSGTATQKSSVVKGVAQGSTKRVKLWKRGNEFGAVVDGSAMTKWTETSQLDSVKYWVALGGPATSGTSDNRYDNLDICMGTDVEVRKLSAGQAVRLYDASDNVIASAVESSGTATLNLESVVFPFTGYLKIFADNTYASTVARLPESGVLDDVRGGDVYAYQFRSQTGITLLGADFHSSYATQQTDSHGSALIRSGTNEMYGSVMGYKGKVQVYKHDLGSKRTWLYDVDQLTDHHENIGLVADSSGYLHIVYGGGGGVVANLPLYYRKSTNPWDPSSWGAATNIGSNLGAFSLLIDQADKLHLLNATTGYGNQLQYRSKTLAGAWSSSTTLMQAYTTFGEGWQIYLTDAVLGTESSGQKSLHFTVYTNGYIGANQYWKHCFYMRSLDGGSTWQGINGTTATLPIAQTSGTGAFTGGGTMVVNGDSYGHRMTVAADRKVHIMASPAGSSTVTYYRGTSGGSFTNPNGKTFSNVRTQSPLGTIQNDTALSYFATAGSGNPWDIVRHLSLDAGDTWVSETMASGSVNSGQWYWPVMIAVPGKDYYKFVWHNRYTHYVDGGSGSVTYEGAASVMMMDVSGVPIKTLTADAQIAARTTASLTADAVVAARSTAQLTADAQVKGVNTASMTGDALVQQTLTSTVTTDARVAARSTQTVTADGLAAARTTVTFTADAVVDPGIVTRTSTLTADALLETRSTLTLTADAKIAVRAIPPAELTAAHSALTNLTAQHGELATLHAEHQALTDLTATHAPQR